MWNHTLLALSLSDVDFDIRLSLLLHDIGKPFSYQDEEVRHFRNHPKISSQISRLILSRLNFKKDYIDKICFLIENHDIPISDELIENNNDLSIELYKIQYCDALAHNPEKLEKRKKYLCDMKEKIYRKRSES